MKKNNSIKRAIAIPGFLLLLVLAVSSCMMSNDSPGELGIVVGSTVSKAITGTPADINLVKVYLQRNGKTFSNNPSDGFYEDPQACLEIPVSGTSSGSYLISDLIPASDYSLVMVAGILKNAVFEPVYFVSQPTLSIQAGQRTSVTFDDSDTKTTPLELVSADPVRSMIASDSQVWMLANDGIHGMNADRVISEASVSKPDTWSWLDVDSLGSGTWFGETATSLWLNSQQGIHIATGTGSGTTLTGAVSATSKHIVYSLSWVLSPADTSSTRILLAILDGNVRFTAAKSSDPSAWEWVDLKSLLDDAGLGQTIQLETFLKSLAYGDGYIAAVTSLGNFLFTDTNIDYLVNGIDWNTTEFGMALLDDPKIGTMFTFPEGTAVHTVDAVRTGSTLKLFFGTSKGLFMATHDYAEGTSTVPSVMAGTETRSLTEIRISEAGSRIAATDNQGGLLVVDMTTANPVVNHVPAQAGVPHGLAGFAWIGQTLVLAGAGGVASAVY